MQKIFPLGFALFLCFQGLSQLKSPNDFFPFNRGEEFTPHHLLVNYLHHVAAESPRVKLIQYGLTNQMRPLLLAFVSSEENIEKLDEIRKNNLSFAGLSDEQINEDLEIAIVWLSYSVHGNEAGGSEACPEVLFELVDPSNEKISEWLKNTVVVIDPSVNPDGYARYTNWFRGISGKMHNSNSQDIEHNEPWPGGRTNHYYFDLNRDWAWQTQTESQQRMVVYNQWLPHVHADLHEMGPTSPYYFAPAAQPYHELISEWQRDFQVNIGKNHARYFDEEGWLYFTREIFDLFYPSYGDTYPIFNGSIGMTYEQGGHSSGGLAYALPNGETLTLKDRIAHHKATSLSTIEVSSQNAEKLISEFKAYFENSINNPKGKYKSYIVKKDTEGHKLQALTELLDKQDIKYGTVDSKKSTSGLSYVNGVNESFEILPGDLVISAYQAKSVLLQVLMDPSSRLVDSITYDITAWALPYAYGLEAYALEKDLKPESKLTFEYKTYQLEESYAYAFKWGSLRSARLVSTLLSKGVQLRRANEKFQLNKQTFEAGTIIANKGDNIKLGKTFHQEIAKVAEDLQVDVFSLKTGFTDSGPNLGSGKMSLIKKPKVFCLIGDSASSNGFGQVKYYFEQELAYPITMIDQDSWSSANLSKFNTMILADGVYNFSENELNKLNDWVISGGKVIAIENAVRAFADKDGFSLKSHETDEAKQEADRNKLKESLEHRYDRYEGEERRYISNQNQGAIVKTVVDNSHPLAFGQANFYFSLKTNNLYFPLMKNAWNVYYTSENPQVYGFIGAKAKEKLKNSLVYGLEKKGQGQIIYMIDNPLFRGFWENGEFVFANCLF